MSDHNLKHTVTFLAYLGVTSLMGCSDTPKEPPPEPPQPAVPMQIQQLGDDELLGIDRGQITLTMGWTAAPLGRDPAPNSARASLHQADFEKGEFFDRAVFTFGEEAPSPGYQVRWNDSLAAQCSDSTAVSPGAKALVIRLEPVTAQRDPKRSYITQPLRQPKLKAIAAAKQLCDQSDRVVWALGAESTRFRVVELQSPPRLIVDVLHPGAEPPAPAPPPPPPPAAADSAAPQR